MASCSAETPGSHGHSFSKKTFHKPTYCHHCTDMLWGLIQQGYICEGEWGCMSSCLNHLCVLRFIAGWPAGLAEDLPVTPLREDWTLQPGAAASVKRFRDLGFFSLFSLKLKLNTKCLIIYIIPFLIINQVCQIHRRRSVRDINLKFELLSHTLLTDFFPSKTNSFVTMIAFRFT